MSIIVTERKVEPVRRDGQLVGSVIDKYRPIVFDRIDNLTTELEEYLITEDGINYIIQE